MKSSNKTHLAKNPFLENALEEWWVKPLGQRHLGLGLCTSSRGGGKQGLSRLCGGSHGHTGRERGPQLQEARLLGGVQARGQPPPPAPFLPPLPSPAAAQYTGGGW